MIKDVISDYTSKQFPKVTKVCLLWACVVIETIDVDFTARSCIA